MTNIKEELVEYDVGGVGMRSCLAWDDDIPGRRPGVLVCPEWWGLDDYVRGRARQLAQLGYVALGVDMYGGGRTVDNPDDAGSAMNAVLSDMDTGRARLDAARQALAAQRQTDPSRIAAIGYCFGGAMALLSDPENYKGEISATFEDQTSMQLEIRGDMNWRYWPPIALAVNDVVVTPVDYD